MLRQTCTLEFILICEDSFHIVYDPSKHQEVSLLSKRYY